MARNYIGKHVPFGVDDDDVLRSLSLKGTDYIGDGEIIGTGHTIDGNGFKPSGVAGSALEFDSTGGTGIITDHSDLDGGFSIQFEVTKDRVEALTGSDTRYMMAWTKNGSATAGWIRIAGHASTADLAVITPRMTDGGTGAVAYITTEGKGDTIKFEFSFKQGILDMFVDEAWIGTWEDSEFSAAASPKFEKLWIGGHSALKGLESYFSNLQIQNRPVSLANYIKCPRIAFVGDSIMGNGQWMNESSMKYKGTDYASDSEQHNDAGSSAECHRWFAKKNLHVEVHPYATASASVEDAGTTIMDQVDGGGSYDVARSQPTWVVFLGGYNDLNGGSPDVTTTGAGTFYDWYTDIIDQIRTRCPQTKILCLSMHTRENSTTYNGAANKTETDNANARIQDAVNAYTSGVYFADFFAYMGGHDSYDTSDYDTDDFHLSKTGCSKVGKYIAEQIYNLL